MKDDERIEDIEETKEETVEEETVEQQDGEKENQPSPQELMLEIAKLKRKADKSASEAAEWKKKFRATQSVQEVADAEKAEQEAKRQEEFESMKRELAINRTEKSYLAMGYTADEAARMATAEVDGDFDAKMKIMGEVDARKKKAYEAEWIKSRPEVNAGSNEESEDLFLKGFNSVKPAFGK